MQCCGGGDSDGEVALVKLKTSLADCFISQTAQLAASRLLAGTILSIQTEALLTVRVMSKAKNMPSASYSTPENSELSATQYNNTSTEYTQ
jgi:hypothetical protein